MKKTILLFFAFLSLSFAHSQYLDWAISLGSLSESDIGREIILDDDGNIYVAGSFSSQVDFDPGPGEAWASAGALQNFNAFIMKLNPAGQLLWVKTVGGLSYCEISCMTRDISGNLYLGGRFRYAVDFDPGPGVHTLTPNLEYEFDAFIQKLDPNGNFIWAKNIGGDNREEIESITVDSLENVYSVGTFEGAADFDPNAGVSNLTAVGSKNMFMLKLNSVGDFAWVKKIGNSEYNVPGSIFTDKFGYLYFTGKYRDTVDFDFGPGVNNLVSNYSGDAFLMKMTLEADFIWVKQIAGTPNSGSTAQGQVVSVDDSGYVYSAGAFDEQVDLDPGPGVQYPDYGGIYILKLKSNGDFVWAKNLVSYTGNYFGSIVIDKANCVYVTGSYGEWTDFDPGPGIVAHQTVAYSDTYVLKLDRNGNYIWATTAGGGGFDTGYSLAVDTAGNVYSTGVFTIEADFDPSADTLMLVSDPSQWYVTNIYIQKLHQDSCSFLTLAVDSVSDIFCANAGYASFIMTGGQSPYTYLWSTNPPSTDSIVQFTSGGIYDLTVSAANGCVLNRSFLINSPDTIYSSEVDLDVFSIGASVRPGFTSQFSLDVFNRGCVASSAGELKVVLDDLLDFGSSIPTPTSISGDTLIWSLASLVYDSTHFLPEVFVSVSNNAGLGSFICNEVWVSPLVGDVDTSNNHKTFCYPVVGSYDPNDKQVYPLGVCDEKYVLKDQKLTYTIRFQNTGNADAINISIIDSLDNYLDLNTVKIISKSHEPMITEVLHNQVLRFSFNNIHLPDSGTNEPASHGYIIFEVNPLDSLPNAAEVRNTAYIYFDYNEPIITNTVLNTLVAELPVCNLSINDNLGQAQSILLYPNPAQEFVSIQFLNPTTTSHIQIFDIYGKRVLSQNSSGNQQSLDIRHLMKGVYFIHVKDVKNNVSIAKMIKE